MTTEPTTEPTNEAIARALGGAEEEPSWYCSAVPFGERNIYCGPDFATPEMCDRWIIPDIERRGCAWNTGRDLSGEQRAEVHPPDS